MESSFTEDYKRMVLDMVNVYRIPNSSRLVEIWVWKLGKRLDLELYIWKVLVCRQSMIVGTWQEGRV